MNPYKPKIKADYFHKLTLGVPGEERGSQFKMEFPKSVILYNIRLLANANMP